MNGRVLAGQLVFAVAGHQWKRSHTPPLYLNLIDRLDHWLALPTDQSGGLRGGDSQRLEVSVRDRGQLLWLPPASSLFYPSAQGGDFCRLENVLTVEPGSRLCFCPKVNIPCFRSAVQQTTSIHLSRGAEFLYWDQWSTGRTGSGEHGEFLSLENRLAVYRGDRPVYQERWKIQGWGQDLGPEKFAGPALLQDSRLWVLGLAQGARPLKQLKERLLWLRSRGGQGEIGLLDEDLWIGRFLSPRALDMAYTP